MIAPQISLVLPAYQECENLKKLLPLLLQQEEFKEILVIDDASHDGTARFFASLKNERVRFFENKIRHGLAESILIGVEQCRFEHILVRDSDFNHDIADLSKFVTHLRQGADFVVASRYAGGRKPLARSKDFFSLLLNTYLHRTEKKISDWTYGYFVVRRSILQKYPLGEIFRGRGEYTLRLYRALFAGEPGLRWQEFPTEVQSRGVGKSSTSVFKHGFAYLKAAFSSKCRSSERRVQKHYAKLHQRHRAAYASAGHSLLGLRARKKMLHKVSWKNESHILDLGCGNGAFLGSLREEQNKEWHITGVDVLEEVLHTAKVQYQYDAVKKASVLEAVDFDQSFDDIFCLEVLQYLPKDKLVEFFLLWKKHLKTEGRLYLLLPNRQSWVHRARKFFLRQHVDYMYAHKLEDILEALRKSGWLVREAWGAGYFSAKVKPLNPEISPPPSVFSTLLALEQGSQSSVDPKTVSH